MQEIILTSILATILINTIVLCIMWHIIRSAVESGVKRAIEKILKENNNLIKNTASTYIETEYGLFKNGENKP